MCELQLSQVEVDAFWSFVKKKKCADAGAGSGRTGEVGPRWGCLSQDRASRFVVAWAFGPTEDELAPEVVRLTRQRTHAQAGASWVSDGRKAYEKAIRRAYRDSTMCTRNASTECCVIGATP